MQRRLPVLVVVCLIALFPAFGLRTVRSNADELSWHESVTKEMDISINTVRNRIRSIYEKLHVHSRSEAVSKALRHGII